MSFPAYLFDYNGVLVDDEEVHWRAFREILSPQGIEMSREDYWEKYLGFDDFGAFRAVLADHGRPGDEATIRALVEAKKPAYLKLAERDLRPFAGAGELLRGLAAGGASIGIVSGALRNEIRLGLELMGAADAVRFIISAEDTRESKPDPEGYRVGIEALSSLVGSEQAKQALVIEDSISGIESAVAAGLSCLAVRSSYEDAALRAAGALRVVPELTSITPKLLSELYESLRSSSCAQC